MKFFVQFKELRAKIMNDYPFQHSPCKPFLVDSCGSDSIFILDGRNSLSTMIQDAKDRIKKLRPVKQIDGFEIHEGDLKSSKIIYQAWRYE